MVNKASNPSSGNFGGQWTIDKLNILEEYLDFYTTALKNQPFKLMYLDVFAGNGEISLRDEDAQAFIEGSAKRAINITDKPFDRLIFVEKDSQRYTRLKSLRKENLNRDIQIKNADANFFLRNLRENWDSRYFEDSYEFKEFPVV